MTPGLSSSGLLCPWVSPDNIGGDFLLQGNLLDSGIEPVSSSLQVYSLPLSHQGSPERGGLTPDYLCTFFSFHRAKSIVLKTGFSISSISITGHFSEM